MPIFGRKIKAPTISLQKKGWGVFQDFSNQQKTLLNLKFLFLPEKVGKFWYVIYVDSPLGVREAFT